MDMWFAIASLCGGVESLERKRSRSLGKMKHLDRFPYVSTR